jgi:hypothetical protein
MSNEQKLTQAKLWAQLREATVVCTDLCTWFTISENQLTNGFIRYRQVRNKNGE